MQTARNKTFFHNLDLIDYGIEIVPVKSLSAEMSTGVSYTKLREKDENI